MLITSLELQNFKSYQQANLRFLPGTNAILGANGAGKSTILEAIGFALFDYQPPGFKLASLLREGATSGSVVVRMVSSLDDRAYDVERNFGATTTTRYRVYDPDMGQAIAEGNEEVRLWLHDHLRVEPTARLSYLFENTVGVPQGTSTTAFQQSAGVRKAVFDPLLQVDEYRKASDNLRATESYLQEQTHEAQREVARIEGRLAELPRLVEERAALERTVSGLETHARQLGLDLAVRTGQLEELDATERHVNTLATRLERSRLALTAHELRLSDARRALQEAQEAHEQVEASRADHEAYQAAEARLRDADEQRTARDELSNRLETIEREQVRLTDALARLGEELRRAHESRERMAELSPQVERQGALEDALRQAQERVRQMEAAARRERQAAAEAEEARQEVVAVGEAMSRAGELEREIAGLQATLDDLAHREQQAREQGIAAKAECERLERQSAALVEAHAARCPVCEAELTPEHRDDLLARNKAQAAELNAVRERMRVQVRSLQKETATGRAALSDAQGRLRQLPTEDGLRAAEERLARRQAAADQAAAELSSLADAPATAERCRQELATLGDPRREYQSHEDRARGHDELVRQREDTLAREKERATAAGDLRSGLAAYAGLDEIIRLARAERDAHLAAHQTYMTHLNVAGQRAGRQSLVAELDADRQRLTEAATDAERDHVEAAAGYDTAGHTSLRQEVAEMRDELARADTRLSATRERQADVNAGIAHLEDLSREMASHQAELDKLAAVQGILRSTRELLRQAGPYVTRHLVHQISCEASAIHADIMDDHTGRLQWSEDYDLSLQVKGHERNFRQFSGGEQMSAALALRLALLRETSAIDVAFFDEPTAHLDPERREGLAEKIMQVKGFSQVFVISHDDTFERTAQHYVRIIKDVNGSHPEDD